MPEFVFNVHDLDEAGKDFVFPVRPAWLASVLEDTEVRVDETAAEGRFTFHAQKQGADVVLHGHLTSTLVTDCGRCLEDARIPVSTAVGSLLTARAADLRPTADEVELSPEDLDREFFSGDEVVLDDIVREHLLLEVPIQPLCAEDCPGIAVPARVAGPSDLRGEGQGGIDPRLAPLLKLVGKKEPTEE